MEEIVLTYPEERSKLLVVRRHELGLGRGDIRIVLAASMTDLQDMVDIFNSTEAFRVSVKNTGRL